MECVVGIKDLLATLASDVDSYLETADVVFSETPTLPVPTGKGQTNFMLAASSNVMHIPLIPLLFSRAQPAST